MFLRAPQMADFAEWAALREQSRDFLMPWEPTWPADDLTRGAFRRRLKRYAEDLRSDQAYPFFLFRKHDNALLGGLTLTNIRRGVAQAGSLGYWIGRALRAPGLHDARRCAPSCPSPSRRCGCTGSKPPASRPTRPRSGCWKRPASSARAMPGEYLCINGIWQDHLLYARLQDDPGLNQYRVADGSAIVQAALGWPWLACYNGAVRVIRTVYQIGS